MLDFVHKDFAVVNSIADQGARTAKWYSRKDKQPQLKLVLKHMSSKLQITSFFPEKVIETISPTDSDFGITRAC
jgi:hypothetical protein